MSALDHTLCQSKVKIVVECTRQKTIKRNELCSTRCTFLYKHIGLQSWYQSNPRGINFRLYYRDLNSRNLRNYILLIHRLNLLFSNCCHQSLKSCLLSMHPVVMEILDKHPNLENELDNNIREGENFRFIFQRQFRVLNVSYLKLEKVNYKHQPHRPPYSRSCFHLFVVFIKSRG